MRVKAEKEVVIGRLVRDIEMAHDSVALFTLTNSVISNGEETTRWHRIAAFGHQAVLCHKRLSKGDLCCVEGRMGSVESEGETKMAVIAENITFLVKHNF